MPDFHSPSGSQSSQFSFFPNSTASSPPPF
jgi:hypothetical protein